MKDEGRGSKVAWLALAPLLVGTFTGTVNNSVVNVPIADILRDLQVPLGSGALVVVGFNLAFAVLMPVSGWFGDRLGRRRTFCGAMILLAVGAAGAAAAPNLPTLVAFRVLQGAATAAVLPGVMAIIASLFTGARRGRALGLWAAVNGAGQAAGPAVGGLLGGWLGWRAIFLPTIPLSLLAVALTMWLVPSDDGRRTRLEWRGAFLLTLSAALLLGGTSAVAPLGVTSPVVWLSVALGIASTILFVLVERRREDAFLCPADLVETRYVRSSLAVVGQMFCLGATLLAVPLYLVREHHASSASAGLLVLSMPLAMMVFAPVAGFATEHLSPRLALRCGLAVLILGELSLVGTVARGVGPGVLLVANLVVIGTGIAFVQTPAAAGATRSRAGQRGAGLGLFNALRFGGSAVGAAWVSAVLGPGQPYFVAFLACVVIGAVALAATFLGADPPPAE